MKSILGLERQGRNPPEIVSLFSRANTTRLVPVGFGQAEAESFSTRARLHATANIVDLLDTDKKEPVFRFRVGQKVGRRINRSPRVAR